MYMYTYIYISEYTQLGNSQKVRDIQNSRHAIRSTMIAPTHFHCAPDWANMLYVYDCTAAVFTRG